MIAAKYGYDEFIDVIAKYEKNNVDNMNKNALYIAIENKHENFVNKLLPYEYDAFNDDEMYKLLQDNFDDKISELLFKKYKKEKENSLSRKQYYDINLEFDCSELATKYNQLISF